MIIYNVTLYIEPAILSEYLNWLKNEHIPRVMATNLFEKYRILKVLTELDGEVESYAVQYELPTMAHFERYEKEFAPALRAETVEKFGEQVTAFRTLLQVEA
jgi:hypothetical protein